MAERSGPVDEEDVKIEVPGTLENNLKTNQETLNTAIKDLERNQNILNLAVSKLKNDRDKVIKTKTEYYKSKTEHEKSTTEHEKSTTEHEKSKIELSVTKNERKALGLLYSASSSVLAKSRANLTTSQNKLEDLKTDLQNLQKEKDSINVQIREQESIKRGIVEKANLLHKQKKKLGSKDKLTVDTSTTDNKISALKIELGKLDFVSKRSAIQEEENLVEKYTDELKANLAAESAAKEKVTKAENKVIAAQQKVDAAKAALDKAYTAQNLALKTRDSKSETYNEALKALEATGNLEKDATYKVKEAERNVSLTKKDVAESISAKAKYDNLKKILIQQEQVAKNEFLGYLKNIPKITETQNEAVSAKIQENLQKEQITELASIGVDDIINKASKQAQEEADDAKAAEVLKIDNEQKAIAQNLFLDYLKSNNIQKLNKHTLKIKTAVRDKIVNDLKLKYSNVDPVKSQISNIMASAQTDAEKIVANENLEKVFKKNKELQKIKEQLKPENLLRKAEAAQSLKKEQEVVKLLQKSAKDAAAKEKAEKDAQARQARQSLEKERQVVQALKKSAEKATAKENAEKAALEAKRQKEEQKKQKQDRLEEERVRQEAEKVRQEAERVRLEEERVRQEQENAKKAAEEQQVASASESLQDTTGTLQGMVKKIVKAQGDTLKSMRDGLRNSVWKLRVFLAREHPLDEASLIYMFVIFLLVLYMVGIAVYKYYDIAFELEYAKRMQALCGSDAMERETTRYIMAEKLFDTESANATNITTLVVGGLIVVIFVAFTIIKKSSFVDDVFWAFWTEPAVIFFHVFVLVTLAMCAASWGVFLNLRTTTNELSQYIKYRDIVAGNLLTNIVGKSAGTDEKPANSMATVRDAIIKRMAHVDNLGSHDEATIQYDKIKSDANKVLAYVKFDNTSKQDITPDVLDAGRVYDLWMKWLKSNTYKNVSSLEKLKANKTYGEMYTYITDKMSAEEKATASTISAALLDKKQKVNYNTDYGHMTDAAAASKNASVKGALGFLSDLTKGNPCDSISSQLHILVTFAYILLITFAYIVFHTFASLVTDLEGRLTLSVILFFLFIGTISGVKMYTEYKNK